jgi:hypothetical protein
MGLDLGFWGWFLWDELDLSWNFPELDFLGFYGILWGLSVAFLGYHFVNSFSDRLRYACWIQHDSTGQCVHPNRKEGRLQQGLKHKKKQIMSTPDLAKNHGL